MKDLGPVCLAIAFMVGSAWTACAQDVVLTDQGSTVTLANNSTWEIQDEWSNSAGACVQDQVAP